jgi:hypothetical protein
MPFILATIRHRAERLYRAIPPFSTTDPHFQAAAFPPARWNEIRLKTGDSGFQLREHKPNRALPSREDQYRTFHYDSRLAYENCHILKNLAVCKAHYVTAGRTCRSKSNRLLRSKTQSNRHHNSPMRINPPLEVAESDRNELLVDARNLVEVLIVDTRDRHR